MILREEEKLIADQDFIIEEDDEEFGGKLINTK